MKTQLKNKAKAMVEHRSRIYNRNTRNIWMKSPEKEKQWFHQATVRPKSRTYNYPQGRITDHRINYTIYNLTAFMDGDIQDCIDHLIVAENAERLKESEL